jgi:hypothetical protein
MSCSKSNYKYFNQFINKTCNKLDRKENVYLKKKNRNKLSCKNDSLQN